VGGSIIAHGIPAVGHGLESLVHRVGGLGGSLLGLLLEAAVGIVVGIVVVAVVTAAGKAWRAARG